MPVHFSAPAFLLLVGGVLLALGIVLFGFYWKRQAVARFAAPSSLAALTPVHSPRRQVVKAVLLLVALSFLALAAARPWWGMEEVTVRREGIDLVIVLDVSLSMQAQDVKPSRFARAQDEVALLLDQLVGNRVGLVFFASSATLRTPLTSDLQAVKQLIARAPEDAAFLSPGSSLAEGIKAAQALLKESKTAGRAILIVSDGEDFSGGAVEAATAAREAGLAVYTAGVGTAEGGVMPVRGPGGQQSVKLDPRTNQPAVTRANAALLRTVAQAGGGRFINLNEASSGLTGLAVDFSRMELTPFAEGGRQRPIERFQWFALAALGLLVVELLLPERRPLPRTAPVTARRRRLAFVPFWLFALIAGCTAATVYKLNEEGNQAFWAGDFPAALRAYREAQQERPDLRELNYNAGNALHRMGDFERAIEESRRATDSDRPALRSQAYYNLGNHYYRQDKLREAFEAYRSALIHDPNDEDAKVNLEIVLRRMQGQQQGAQGQPGQGDQAPAGPSDQPAPPNGQAPQPGTPQAGALSPDPALGSEEQTRRALEEALRGINEQFTLEDALRILDLLRRQQVEQARQRSLQPGSRSTAPDW